MAWKVFGKEVAVKKIKDYAHCTGNYALAEMGDEYKITIDAGLKGQKLDETIIHELGHIVFHRILAQARIPRELEELIVEGIAVAVSENFTLKKRP